MKIQYKILVLLIGVFVVYTLLSTGFIYYSISNYAFADFYKRLEIRAAVAAKIMLEKPQDVNSIRKVRQEYLEKLPGEVEYIIPIENGVAFADSIPPSIPTHFVEQIIRDTVGDFNVTNTLYAGIRYRTQAGAEYIVIVSAENYFYTHHIAYLQNLLITSLIIGIVWIIASSMLISRTLFHPIKTIIKDVQKIGSENLHLRLKTPSRNDSLQKLTLTFNDMLNRLETSFEMQKNFISNASHELNTPLTSIIAEGDFALSRKRTSEEYRKALEKMLEGAENLNKKTNALLFLAQTGYDGKSQKFEIIRIDQLLLDVKETVQKINSAFQISIDFSLLPENPDKLKVRGNQQLLHLAVSNIVINGCKYSDNQVVYLALGSLDKEVVIIVRDSGIGIPEKEMPYIYDPYFRASNTVSYKGYGIGLPLSRNIIRMHKGTLTVTSVQDRGTTVQINLPTVHIQR